MKPVKFIKLLLAITLPLSGLIHTGLAEDKHEHSMKEEVTLKGEIVDIMCYVDHGAKGEKHSSCATKCIKSGGPVGLLTESGDLYLIIGEHKPINSTLAPLASKTVTLKGSVSEKGGIKLLANSSLVK